jgi:hypothetical protein
MQETPLAASSQRYISLRAPQSLRVRIVQAAQDQGRPLREFCQEVINRFIDYAETVAKDGRPDAVLFVATYKASGGALIGFWMDPHVAARVASLARWGHVSRRALCYTAFTRAFPADPLNGVST